MSHQSLPLFGVLIPPHPLLTAYTQQSPTQFLFQIPRDAIISTPPISNSTSVQYTTPPELMVFKFPQTQPIPQGMAIGIYFCFDEGEGFEYLGFLAEGAMSVRVRVPEIPEKRPQGTFGQEGFYQQQQQHGFLPVQSTSSTPNCYIGLSLESVTEIQNKHQNVTLRSQRRQHSQLESVVKACANSLHSFLTSFVQQQGDRIVMPANAIDRWLQKVEKKVARDPDYFLKGEKFQ